MEGKAAFVQVKYIISRTWFLAYMLGYIIVPPYTFEMRDDGASQMHRVVQ